MSKHITWTPRPPSHLTWFRVDRSGGGKWDPASDRLPEPASRMATREHSERSTIAIPIGRGWDAHVDVIPYIDERGEPHALVSDRVIGVGIDPLRRSAQHRHVTDREVDAVESLLVSHDEQRSKLDRARRAIGEAEAYAKRLDAAWAEAAVSNPDDAPRIDVERRIAAAQLKGARLIFSLLGDEKP